MKSVMRWLAAGLFLVMLVGMVDEAAAQRRAGWRMYGRSQPWFYSPTVRQQLKLDDTQYNTLNKAYVQYWTPYNQAVTALPADLNEAERQKRIAAAYGTFNTGFNKAATQVFVDPDVRNRYGQLQLQYQGYGAFNDPTLQTRLKLSDQQVQDFNRYYTDWNKQMNTYADEYATNPQAVNKQFPTSWKDIRGNINSTLNADQRKAWAEMTGDPYDFPADAYFGDGETRGQERREDRQERREERRENPAPRVNPPRENAPPR